MDPAAFEELFAHHERSLHIVVRRWVLDPEDAAEIVQEAGARVWKVHHKLRPDSAAAYLYRTALNLAASKRRWKGIRQALSHKLVSHSETLAPETIVLDREQKAALRDAIKRLPEDLRRVVELRDVAELSYAEIARILEIKEGTVGSRRNAALARLRVALTIAFAAALVAGFLLRHRLSPPPQDPTDELLQGVHHPALVGWGRTPPPDQTRLEPVATQTPGVRMYRLTQ